jgi:IS5 family transposase
MYRERDGQSSFWGDPLYEVILPKDHYLRQLAQVVDFKKVNEMTKDLYSQEMGRPCHEPALLFKMIFLQFLYDISDREIEEQVRYNIAYKWFAGLNAEEMPPDHSTLSVFRDRLGAEQFQKIFNWIVAEAKAKGFVNDRMHVIDSTAIQAKADTLKIRFGKNKERDKGDKDDLDCSGNGHPEQDARWGYKRKDKPFFGFKFHAGLDADSEIITRCEITSGNRHDSKSFFDVMNLQAGAVAADKGYDVPFVHYVLAGSRVMNLIYRRRRENQRVRERSWIERKFSECKHRHGLEEARYWGLMKMRIQGYMTAMVVNVKRMLKLSTAPPMRLAVSRAV